MTSEDTTSQEPSTDRHSVFIMISLGQTGLLGYQPTPEQVRRARRHISGCEVCKERTQRVHDVFAEEGVFEELKRLTERESPES